MLVNRLVFSFLALSFLSSVQAQVDRDISIVPFATGFDRPVDIVNAGDERLFVVEKEGYVRILRPDGQVDSRPFLDLSELTSTGGLNSERGLLGLAFHPDFESNGFLFVNYTDLSQDTRIVRYTVSADPDSVDQSSDLPILSVDQPFGNHNGGCLRFGADGYLYIAMGDGGSAEDPFEYGQNMASHLGKMLRIDIDGALPYEVPSSNPFLNTGSDTLPEIWASGLRNPWRFSFDRLTGDLFIGDVGQYLWEEIDYQSFSSSGGENYGWSCYEGNHPGFGMNCPPIADFDAPITEFSHDDGHCSVTGGYVYRGDAYPALNGKYFYTDYCSGQFWSAESNAPGAWSIFEVSNTTGFGWTCFGEDYLGEIYVANQIDDTIYRLTDALCGDDEASISVQGDGSLMASAGLSYQWYRDGQQIPLSTFQTLNPSISGLYTVRVKYGDECYDLAESVSIELGPDCTAFGTAPVDLTKSFDPVDGVRDRVQLKWFKESPEVRYTVEDNPACDIEYWAYRYRDDEFSPWVNIPPAERDTSMLPYTTVKKNNNKELFKWPLKFRLANGTNQVLPNRGYRWRVRCYCDQGALINGEQVITPWSEEKFFNTPDFDAETGIYTPPIGEIFSDELKSIDRYSALNVYPNPLSDSQLHVELNHTEKLLDGSFQFIIRAIDGELILTRTIEAKDTQRLEVDFQGKLDRGAYVIEIKSENVLARETLIIQ